MEQVEISLVHGFIFDLTIPLQYHFHQTLSKAHAQHLEHYWPLFIFGTMIEFVTFFLVHPDLFTLVVCLKTTILLGIWLGRDDRGGFLTIKLRGKGIFPEDIGMGPVIGINSKEKEEKSNGYGTVRETKLVQENSNEGGKKKRKGNESKDGKQEKPKTMSKYKKDKLDKETFKPSSKSEKEKKYDKAGKEKRTKKEKNPSSKRSGSFSTTPSSASNISSPSSPTDNSGTNSQTASTPFSETTNDASEAPSTLSSASSTASTPGLQEPETAAPSLPPGSSELSTVSSRGNGTPKLEERNAVNEIKPKRREVGETKSGRNRYDLKGFKGNLMPIRKEIYTGPRGN
ncbi:hypothetical protein D1P53_000972 [Cryptococcus gattii VGV]|nr:hypothetical protein D1P53_000972 [Cryptococcus gattii VGV]